MEGEVSVMVAEVEAGHDCGWEERAEMWWSCGFSLAGRVAWIVCLVGVARERLVSYRKSSMQVDVMVDDAAVACLVKLSDRPSFFTRDAAKAELQKPLLQRQEEVNTAWCCLALVQLGRQ